MTGQVSNGLSTWFLLQSPPHASLITLPGRSNWIPERKAQGERKGCEILVHLLVHEALSASRQGCSLLPEYHVVNLKSTSWPDTTKTKCRYYTFSSGGKQGKKIPRKATGLYRDQMKRLLKWVIERQISQEPRHETSVNKFTRLKCDRVTS